MRAEVPGFPRQRWKPPLRPAPAPTQTPAPAPTPAQPAAPTRNHTPAFNSNGALRGVTSSTNGFTSAATVAAKSPAPKTKTKTKTAVQHQATAARQQVAATPAPKQPKRLAATPHPQAAAQPPQSQRPAQQPPGGGGGVGNDGGGGVRRNSNQVAASPQPWPQSKRPAQQSPSSSGGGGGGGGGTVAGSGGIQRNANQMGSPIELVPERFRSVFKYPTFNKMQSAVLPELLGSDCNMVLSAPTGAGKTVVLELGLVRLFSSPDHGKAVYIAPIKALCSERESDWLQKFSGLGYKVKMWTGDLPTDDDITLSDIRDADIVLTTPEKWHNTTKSWRNQQEMDVARCCNLVMIDEAHLLNDNPRGGTLEAAISRMQTIHEENACALRLIAISATIPNIEDLAEWLGAGVKTPAVIHEFGEEYRPVKLEIEVESYRQNGNDWAFDKVLDAKVGEVMARYNPRFKPTLVFTNTRKGCFTSAAAFLNGNQSARLIMDLQHRHQLQGLAGSIQDRQIADLVARGIGVHHAGLDPGVRRTIENSFRNGRLRLLFTTSTLALGVNLPAYLVIVKNTQQYQPGGLVEYKQHMVLQMIGRAGRPQFETEGKAVIMTRSTQKQHYLELSTGNQLVESHFKNHMLGHLLAEIALGTITDLPSVLSWLKYSYFWVRVQKNPRHYDLPALGNVGSALTDKLQELALKDIEKLEAVHAVTLSEDLILSSTDAGKQMAKWNIAYDTFKTLIDGLQNPEQLSLGDVILMVASANEFGDISIRNNEKVPLRQLNKPKKAANQNPIRFPIAGKGAIKTTAEKVSVLIQATLSNYEIAPSGPTQLAMDVDRIFIVGQRVANFLLAVVELPALQPTITAERFQQVMDIAQGLKTRLWHDSEHIGRQLGGIGRVGANKLANHKLTTYSRLVQASTSELEKASGRNTGQGKVLLKELLSWPLLKLEVTTTKVTNDTKISVMVAAVKPGVLGASKDKFTSWMVSAVSGSKLLLAKRVHLWTLRKSPKAGVQVTFRVPHAHHAIDVRLKCLSYAGIDRHYTIPSTIVGAVEKFNLNVDALMDSSDEEEGLSASSSAASSTTTSAKKAKSTKAKPSSAKLKAAPKKKSSATLDRFVEKTKGLSNTDSVATGMSLARVSTKNARAQLHRTSPSGRPTSDIRRAATAASTATAAAATGNSQSASSSSSLSLSSSVSSASMITSTFGAVAPRDAAKAASKPPPNPYKRSTGTGSRTNHHHNDTRHQDDTFGTSISSSSSTAASALQGLSSSSSSMAGWQPQRLQPTASTSSWQQQQRQKPTGSSDRSPTRTGGKLGSFLSSLNSRLSSGFRTPTEQPRRPLPLKVQSKRGGGAVPIFDLSQFAYAPSVQQQGQTVRKTDSRKRVIVPDADYADERLNVQRPRYSLPEHFGASSSSGTDPYGRTVAASAAPFGYDAELPYRDDAPPAQQRYGAANTFSFDQVPDTVGDPFDAFSGW